MADLTKHGARRLRRRISTSMPSDKEYLQRVLKYGLREEDVEGDLAGFLSAKKVQNGPRHECVIYAQAMHIFTKDQRLVTVYRLPANLIPEADRTGAEKHRRVKAESSERRKQKEQSHRAKYLAKKRKAWLEDYETEINLRF